MLACQESGTTVADYMVAPVFIEGDEGKGGHEWAIEFVQNPPDLEVFAKRLDLHLQSVNSDYEAKRYKDMALLQIKVNAVPSGTFQKWMRQRGKVGGQNKVPRLSNERKYLEQILTMT